MAWEWAANLVTLVRKQFEIETPPPCPLCGSTRRSMDEYLVAECSACNNDTREDLQPGFYATAAARKRYPARPESWR